VSPLARSKAILEGDGWYVEKVEHWNAFARKRQDLFGFLDLLCLKSGQVMGVQVTTRNHLSDRYKKILLSPLLSMVLDSGIVIYIHGWGKLKNGWDCKIVQVTE